MTVQRHVLRMILAVIMLSTAAAGAGLVWSGLSNDRITVTAYFDNSNGIFVGDEVRILGVRVGEIQAIEPQPQRVRITFWYDGKYAVPADAHAVILSPSLVTARAIQLTPVFSGGTQMVDDDVIPQERTAVPVEWDDFRQQLEKLTHALQPTQPGGVSTLGAFINTAADNMRGRGTDMRDTIIELSGAFSALGDHSADIFSTVRGLALLVSALQDSTTLMRQLNHNLASVSGVLSNDPAEVESAVAELDSVAGEIARFVADNRESVGVTTDKLALVLQALHDSREDIEQSLHVAPTAFQNLVNIYQPAQGGLSGALVMNNFANPITFLCGAIQAASRLGAEQSAKLCVQYLAPIIKNRQYNFPPLGMNPFVGASARPNEVTYSEHWLRPKGSLPQTLPGPAEAALTDPADGLPGLMVPSVSGS